MPPGPARSRDTAPSYTFSAPLMVRSRQSPTPRLPECPFWRRPGRRWSGRRQRLRVPRDLPRRTRRGTFTIVTGAPGNGPLTEAAVDASSCPHTHRTASGRLGVAHDGHRFTDGVLAVAVFPAALLGVLPWARLALCRWGRRWRRRDGWRRRRRRAAPDARPARSRAHEPAEPEPSRPVTRTLTPSPAPESLLCRTPGRTSPLLDYWSRTCERIMNRRADALLLA